MGVTKFVGFQHTGPFRFSGKFCGHLMNLNQSGKGAWNWKLMISHDPFWKKGRLIYTLLN